MRHRNSRSLLMLPTFPLLLVMAAADVQTTPRIRALMHRQYTVSRAPLNIIRSQIESQAPDWEQLQQAGDKFVTLAETLAKTTPRHGSEESWRHLIDHHTTDARAMADAAKARDLVPLREAHRRIGESCKSCHEAHRFRRGG